MSSHAPAARTPGATRAGAGEYLFDLAKLNKIKGGPDYSSVEGGCVEGDRMIVALMRMPAGTGAEPHSHPNEQWIYILEGTFKAKVGEKEMEAKPGSVVTITVKRAGHPVTLHAKLADVTGHGGYLGIAATTVFQPTSPLGAIRYTGTGFAQVITGSGSALAQLPKAIPSLFAKDRSQTAAGNVSSVVGAARETGQAVAANVGWQYKVSFVLLLIASLNIFVGILNLLPLLPMDGGHIAVVLWEVIRRWFARLRGRADPGLVDYRKLVPVSFSIFFVLVVFGMMLILADIVNPVNIG